MGRFAKPRRDKTCIGSNPIPSVKKGGKMHKETDPIKRIDYLEKRLDSYGKEINTLQWRVWFLLQTIKTLAIQMEDVEYGLFGAE